MLTERQSKGCFCARLLEKISQIAEVEAERDMWKARYYQAVAERGKGVRDVREAPYAENTPSSKQNFKKDSPEERRARQGGAKPGHEGHGCKGVSAEEADERRAAEAPATCLDCGAALVPVGPRSRVLRDVPPPKFANVHWTVRRGMCPHCRKTFEGEVPGAMPRFAATNRALAEIPTENNRAERGVRGLCIARKTSFGGQSEDALWVRGANQSVLESLALLYDDPSAALAEALTQRSAHAAKPPCISKKPKSPLAERRAIWYHICRFHHVRAWRSGSAVDC